MRFGHKTACERETETRRYLISKRSSRSHPCNLVPEYNPFPQEFRTFISTTLLQELHTKFKLLLKQKRQMMQ